MPEPASTRPPLLPPHVLKVLAIAFAIGLALFLLLWMDQRGDNDFFKATGSDADAAQGDTLPAPLPADVASEDGTASGLRIPQPERRPDGLPDAEVPRIIEPPAPPPLAAEPSTPSAPASANSELPVPISRPAPRYPQEALRRNVGGSVRVQVEVGPDGSVQRMELASSSGNRLLDRAAMEAVRRWQFRPAVRNGQPVTATVIVPLEFNPGG